MEDSDVVSCQDTVFACARAHIRNYIVANRNRKMKHIYFFAFIANSQLVALFQMIYSYVERIIWGTFVKGIDIWGIMSLGFAHRWTLTRLVQLRHSLAQLSGNNWTACCGLLVQSPDMRLSPCSGVSHLEGGAYSISLERGIDVPNLQKAIARHR